MVRWYLQHALGFSAVLFAAGALLPALGPSVADARGTLRRPSRAEWVWGAVLIAEAAFHFEAWAIFTDPDALYYGVNWQGIYRLGFLAIATPVGALSWLLLARRRSRPAV
jgi:hypothetical protein